MMQLTTVPVSIINYKDKQSKSMCTSAFQFIAQKYLPSGALVVNGNINNTTVEKLLSSIKKLVAGMIVQEDELHDKSLYTVQCFSRAEQVPDIVVTEDDI
jgi:hypothetical protein